LAVGLDIGHLKGNRDIHREIDKIHIAALTIVGLCIDFSPVFHQTSKENWIWEKLQKINDLGWSEVRPLSYPAFLSLS
jgi:hypothetical protein